MATNYSFRWTDPSKQQFNVNAGTIDTLTTPLTLVSRGTPNWGQGLQQNLLFMLENFASAISPANPTIGQFWHDLGTSITNVYTHPLISAGSFVIGSSYTIVSAGSTNFTLIGSTNNNPGTTFVASGIGAGSGTSKASIAAWTTLGAGGGGGGGGTGPTGPAGPIGLTGPTGPAGGGTGGTAYTAGTGIIISTGNAISVAPSTYANLIGDRNVSFEAMPGIDPFDVVTLGQSPVTMISFAPTCTGGISVTTAQGGSGGRQQFPSLNSFAGVAQTNIPFSIIWYQLFGTWTAGVVYTLNFNGAPFTSGAVSLPYATFNSINGATFNTLNWTVSGLLLVGYTFSVNVSGNYSISILHYGY